MEHYTAVHPVKYYQDYLTQNVRPDGREFDRFRPVSININSIGTADGSAVVRIGHTSVVCGIKAELGIPKAEEPDRGFLFINVELSPLCLQEFKPGPPSKKAQALTGFLNNIVSTSEIVDVGGFCIHADKLVWSLYCDIVCLDYDGSITDACFAALIAALHSVTLPKVEYNNETGEIRVLEDVRTPITILREPVSVTFAVFDDNIILADPCNEEECLSTGTLTVITDGDKLFCVNKAGGIPLTENQMQTCIGKSKKRSTVIKELIKTARNA